MGQTAGRRLMQVRKYFRYLLWPIALLLGAWTLSQLPPLSEILTSVTALQWQDWFAWLAINGLIIFCGTQRWRLLLTMLKAPIGLARLVCIRQAGQAISFITPGPQFGGEPLQVFWLCRRGLPLQKVLLSVVLDRFFELWINFSILIIAAFVIAISLDKPVVSYQQIFGLFAILLMVPVTILCLFHYVPTFNSTMLKRWANHPRLKNIKTHWHHMSADIKLALATQKPQLLCALFLSLAGWLWLIGEMVLLLHFLNITLDIAEFSLLLVALRLALLLPIPGGVGTVEASVFWSFQMLGLSTSAALGLIALMRLRDLTMLLFGFVCMRLVSARKVPQLATN